jgi:hypothetical protein
MHAPGTAAATATGARVAKASALCDKALGVLPVGEVRQTIEGVRARLLEPLRLAVAGDESSGKSTLVNALLEQRVAPTDVGPCTKVVTWFRYGPSDRAELVLRGGDRTPLRLVDGMLPGQLPVDPLLCDRIEVQLSNNALRDVIVIDTPGLGARDTGAAERTRELLAMRESSKSSIATADALVFLLPQTARDGDRRFLQDFSNLVRSDDAAPITAVGVLSKADTVGHGDRRVGDERAAELAASLSSSVCTVVPVVALLAETATAGGLTEVDAEALRALAAEPAATRKALLAGADFFRSTESEVSSGHRVHLWALLQLYGIRKCFEWIDDGQTGASRLGRALVEDSGVAALRAVIEASFLQEADTLKAAAAFRQLSALAGSGSPEERAGLERLAEGLESLETQLLQRLRELWALQEAGRSELAPERLSEVVLFFRAGPPHERLALPESTSLADLTAEVRRRAARWNAVVNESTGRERRIAEVVRRSSSLLWEELHEADAA